MLILGVATPVIFILGIFFLPYGSASSEVDQSKTAMAAYDTFMDHDCQKNIDSSCVAYFQALQVAAAPLATGDVPEKLFATLKQCREAVHSAEIYDLFPRKKFSC